MSDYQGTYTTNLNLSKDSVDDSYDVERVNSNSDKIDKWAGEITTQLNEMEQKVDKSKLFNCEISTNQSFTSSGVNDIIFNTITADDPAAFELDITTGKIKILKDGIYSIVNCLRLSSQSFNGAKFVNIQVYKNGVACCVNSYMWQRDLTSTYNTIWTNISTLLDLKKNDVINITISTSENINYSVVKATGQTYLSIKEVL